MYNNFFYSINRMSKNMFYSIQSKNYHNDNTYRIFNKNEFVKELADAYLKSPHIVNRCRKIVLNYIEDFIYDTNVVWANEYGKIDPYDELNLTLVNFNSIDECKVIMMPSIEDNALFFKILPKEDPNENCDFLSNKNTSNWDGYFIDTEKNTIKMDDDECIILSKKLNKLCKNKNTQMVNGFYAINGDYNNPVWNPPRIEMYFAY